MEVLLRVEEGQHPGASFPIPEAGGTLWVGSSRAAQITIPDPQVAPRSDS